MGRRATIPKTRVYVECTNENRRVKGKILDKTDTYMKVLLPTGFIMSLKKRHKNGVYLFHTGVLEFVSDGQPVV